MGNFQEIMGVTMVTMVTFTRLSDYSDSTRPAISASRNVSNRPPNILVVSQALGETHEGVLRKPDFQKSFMGICFVRMILYR